MEKECIDFLKENSFLFEKIIGYKNGKTSHYDNYEQIIEKFSSFNGLHFKIKLNFCQSKEGIFFSIYPKTFEYSKIFFTKERNVSLKSKKIVLVWVKKEEFLRLANLDLQKNIYFNFDLFDEIR